MCAALACCALKACNMQLCQGKPAVESWSPVIEGSIPHMDNLLLRQLEVLCNILRYIQNSPLLLGANVVHLTHNSLMQHTCKGFCYVLNI